MGWITKRLQCFCIDQQTNTVHSPCKCGSHTGEALNGAIVAYRPSLVKVYEVLAVTSSRVP
jgi:hypothetical protein